MKLIVGLGNPGKEYNKTRHNIGFELLDYLYGEDGYNNKFNGLYKEIMVDNEKNILLKPQSYMNLSGTVIRKYIDYFKIKLNDILIIQDDLDMDVGKIKFVFNSSSGGHNGIKDIEKNLSSKEYLRLKIGISNKKNIDTKDYVLGKFSKEEQSIIDMTYLKLKDVIFDFNTLTTDKLMNKYNNK